MAHEPASNNRNVQNRFAELVAKKHAENLVFLHTEDRAFTVDLFDVNLAVAVKQHLEELGHLVLHDSWSTKLSVTLGEGAGQPQPTR